VFATKHALSATTPTLGVTLPLTGVQASVAKELEIGYRLAAAATGVSIQVLDDSSSPANVAKNVQQLAADPSVFALSGIVGTPHAEAGLAAAKAAKLPVVGIRSGAQFLRDGAPSIFHLRASYEDELSKMVAYCSGAGIKRMAIMYSKDSFGTSSRDHLVRELKRAGVEVASVVPVERSGSNVAEASQLTADAAKDGYTAVALLLIVKPMLAAVHELRGVHGLSQPILAMSFTITSEVAALRDGELTGLSMVSAFPLPRLGTGLPQLFRRSLAKSGHPPVLANSVTAYEGFFYGMVAGQAAVLGDGSRAAVMQKLQSGFQLSDVKVSFQNGVLGYQHLQMLYKSRDGMLRA
jgi:ABC-type branched-subunit amino acid transport system substrate-binding protein